MAFERLNGDLGYIALLDDEPNDVGGLSPAELKAEFDRAPIEIQTFINAFLTELEGNTAAGNIGIQAEGVSGETVQAAIEDLKNQLDGAAFENVLTRNSIKDPAMLMDLVVTAAKVAFNYAGSSEKGGAANSVAHKLTFADGTEYDGSAGVNVDCDSIGAMKNDVKYAASASQGGAAASVAQGISFDSSGMGDASGTAYNGAAAKVISYNTLGAQKKLRSVQASLWAGATQWDIAVTGAKAGTPTDQVILWEPTTDSGYTARQNSNIRAVNPNPTAGYIRFKADTAPGAAVPIIISIFD